jgi:hypothetical protein
MILSLSRHPRWPRQVRQVSLYQEHICQKMSPIFPLAKFRAIAIATATHDSHYHGQLMSPPAAVYVTAILALATNHLGQRNSTNSNDPISVMLPKVAKASRMPVTVTNIFAKKMSPIFPLAKLSAAATATVTHDRHYHRQLMSPPSAVYVTAILALVTNHLGRCNSMNKNDPISVTSPKVAKASRVPVTIDNIFAKKMSPIFPLAKLSATATATATATHDRHYHRQLMSPPSAVYVTAILALVTNHLGRRNSMNRNNPISVTSPKVAKASMMPVTVTNIFAKKMSPIFPLAKLSATATATHDRHYHRQLMSPRISCPCHCYTWLGHQSPWATQLHE